MRSFFHGGKQEASMTKHLIAASLMVGIYTLIGSWVLVSAQSTEIVQDYVAYDIYFNHEGSDFKRLHLRNFASELKSRHDETGYIICYSGENGGTAEASKEMSFVRNYLIRTKKINQRRFMIIEGGERPRGVTEIFFVPKGANPPRPSPNK